MKISKKHLLAAITSAMFACGIMMDTYAIDNRGEQIEEYSASSSSSSVEVLQNNQKKLIQVAPGVFQDSQTQLFHLTTAVTSSEIEKLYGKVKSQDFIEVKEVTLTEDNKDMLYSLIFQKKSHNTASKYEQILLNDYLTSAPIVTLSHVPYWDNEGKIHFQTHSFFNKGVKKPQILEYKHGASVVHISDDAFTDENREALVELISYELFLGNSVAGKMLHNEFSKLEHLRIDFLPDTDFFKNVIVKEGADVFVGCTCTDRKLDVLKTFLEKNKSRNISNFMLCLHGNSWRQKLEKIYNVLKTYGHSVTLITENLDREQLRKLNSLKNVNVKVINRRLINGQCRYFLIDKLTTLQIEQLVRSVRPKTIVVEEGALTEKLRNLIFQKKSHNTASADEETLLLTSAPIVTLLSHVPYWDNEGKIHFQTHSFFNKGVEKSQILEYKHGASVVHISDDAFTDENCEALSQLILAKLDRYVAEPNEIAMLSNLDFLDLTLGRINSQKSDFLKQVKVKEGSSISIGMQCDDNNLAIAAIDALNTFLSNNRSRNIKELRLCLELQGTIEISKLQNLAPVLKECNCPITLITNNQLLCEQYKESLKGLNVYVNGHYLKINSNEQTLISQRNKSPREAEPESSASSSHSVTVLQNPPKNPDQQTLISQRNKSPAKRIREVKPKSSASSSPSQNNPENPIFAKLYNNTATPDEENKWLSELSEKDHLNLWIPGSKSDNPITKFVKNIKLNKTNTDVFISVPCTVKYYISLKASLGPVLEALGIFLKKNSSNIGNLSLHLISDRLIFGENKDKIADVLKECNFPITLLWNSDTENHTASLLQRLLRLKYSKPVKTMRLEDWKNKHSAEVNEPPAKRIREAEPESSASVSDSASFQSDNASNEHNFPLINVEGEHQTNTREMPESQEDQASEMPD